MRISTIKYHMEQGFRGIFKNGLMSLASILTVSACSLILIISMCLVFNLDFTLSRFEKSMGISIFLGDEISSEEVEEIYIELQKIENVDTIQFLSKEDALNWAIESWGDEGEILVGLEDDNPFPRSFEITIVGAKYQKDVIKKVENLQKKFEIKHLKVAELKGGESEDLTLGNIASIEDYSQYNLKISGKNYTFKGIEKIRDSQKEAEIISTMNNILRISSIFIILVLSFISVVIIMNTIKLTVYVRRSEINIMKYIGATDSFIRWPFIIEGVLIGLIGSLIPSIISWLGYNKLLDLALTKFNIEILSSNILSSVEVFIYIFPTTILLGILLGSIGSVSSIKKHLNV